VKAPMLLARCSRADLVFEHRGGNDYRSTTPVLFSDTYTFHVLDRFVFDVCVVLDSSAAVVCTRVVILTSIDRVDVVVIVVE
jgi:hypothetical protein